MERDWNERFEKGQSSHRVWLVPLGFIILLGTAVTTDAAGKLTLSPLWPLFGFPSERTIGAAAPYAARGLALLWAICLIAIGIQRRPLPPDR